MRAARGRWECQGPRGRISRRPCLQRGGLRPHGSTGGLGRRETLVSGGLKGREGSCSFGLGVGLPVPASTAAGLRALAFPSAGSGLDATRPRPARHRAYPRVRPAPQSGVRRRGGYWQLGCLMIGRETSPLPHCSAGNKGSRWSPRPGGALAAGRLRERLGGPTTLFGKAQQRCTPRRGFGQTSDAEIKVRAGKSPNVFDDKLEEFLVHGGDGSTALCKESRYP